MSGGFEFCVVMVPVVEFISCDVGVEIGSNVSLRCVGSSMDGDATLTWSTPLNLTLPTPTLTAEDSLTMSSTIVLEDVTDDYSGLYFCTVSNRFGQVDNNVTVAVISESIEEQVHVNIGEPCHSL